MSDSTPLAPTLVHAPVSSDATTMMRYDANKKSAVVAYLLLIFLGGFGAHRFYLGRTGSAVAMLVITIVSFVLAFVYIGLLGFIVIGVWCFVDLFLVPGLVSDFNNKLISTLGR